MLMVYVTCKDQTEARYIARHLLELKLIACANFFPGRSMYTWKGEIEERDEHVMIMKTAKRHFEELKREVIKLHSADVPCIVGYQMHGGHEDYLKWLKDSVK